MRLGTRYARMTLLILIAMGTSSSQAAEPAKATLIRTIAPLSVRGVNYFPHETPWGGLWTKTPAEVWQRDMELAASLGINTVRTFLTFSPQMEKEGLVKADGTPSPEFLAKIEHALASAWQNGIRVILCFEFSKDWLAAPQAEQRWQAALRAVVTPHQDDGRVLMWDLMNEPESDEKWNDGTRAYLQNGLPFLQKLDANHLTTIGLTWRIDRVAPLGLPDVMQYHEYCPKEQLFAAGPPRVRQTIARMRKVGGDRPLFIGEFGMSTARDPKYGVDESLRAKLGEPPGSEAEQTKLYEIVLAAAEQDRIAGVMAWCLHDYPIKNPNESHFGLIRGDGSLKPAALLLRETFARWKGN